MTKEQARALAAIICRTIDYFIALRQDKLACERDLATALEKLKGIP
jgi:hypothetical protein